MQDGFCCAAAESSDSKQLLTPTSRRVSVQRVFVRITEKSEFPNGATFNSERDLKFKSVFIHFSYILPFFILFFLWFSHIFLPYRAKCKLVFSSANSPIISSKVHLGSVYSQALFKCKKGLKCTFAFGLNCLLQLSAFAFEIPFACATCSRRLDAVTKLCFATKSQENIRKF